MHLFAVSYVMCYLNPDWFLNRFMIKFRTPQKAIPNKSPITPLPITTPELWFPTVSV